MGPPDGAVVKNETLDATSVANRPLSGRVVILTGASSGFGAHFVGVLLAAGGTVVAVARRRDRLEELASSSEHCHFVVHDIAELDAADALVQQVVADHDHVDVLVNNAGITNVIPALREPIDSLRDVLTVNLLGPLALSQAAARAMRLNDGDGAIVNIASVIGLMSEPTLPQASYAASKGGVLSMTRELANQWARYGIRVNAIAPGIFPTEMTDELVTNGSAVEDVCQRVPMRRIGRIDELDGALMFLVSDASSYMTGQVLTVDGGLTIV